VKLPRGKARKRILSEGELSAILKALRREGERRLIPLGFLLQLYTLARPGEVFGLPFSEVVEEKTGLAPGFWWTLPEERSKTRVVIRRPLSEPAVEVMRQVDRVRRGAYAPWTLAFRRRGKLQIRTSEWTKPFRRILADIGFEGDDLPKPHDLRRTSRTLLSKLGVRVEVAEALMGHGLPTIIGTYDVYAWEREKREALDLLAAELARIEKLDALGGEAEADPLA
jgi:integrase